MRYLIVAAALSFLFQPVSADCESLPDEVSGLSVNFQKEIGNKTAQDNYLKAVEREILRFTDGQEAFYRPQYLVFVDRNPGVQTGLVAYLDVNVRRVVVLGIFSISTGNSRRQGHFETPVGIFRNSPENMSYRALGTKNSKGWRGLGKKGSRVWDFGWQETKMLNGSPYKIRMLMHATDPDAGESRLGKVDSKGCVRIPAKVNAFLDRYGILDASYENGSGRVRAALLQVRLPSQFSGQYLIIGDSRNFLGA